MRSPFRPNLLHIYLAALLLAQIIVLFRPHPLTAAQPLTVRVGFYENPPKLTRINQEEPRGIFPDILDHIARAENWEIQWKPGTWQEGLARLERGEIDIMPDVAYSLSRAEKYIFSDEPVFVNWAAIYSRGGLDISSMLDLDNRKVGVMRGSIHTEGPEGIKQQARGFNLSCTFVEFDSYDEIFQALHNKIIDVGVVNRLYGAGARKLYDVLPTRIVFNPRHLKFAFPQNGPLTDTLKEAIDRHLRQASLQADSPLHRIIESYLARFPLSRTAVTTDGKIYLTPDEMAWIKEHPIIRVGIDPEFAPFEFIDANSQYSGFASDYLEILRRRLGLNLEIIDHLSWKEVMLGARKKEIDLLAAVGFTAERSRFLSYTMPYTGFYRMIFCRTEAPFISGVHDLRDLKVAVQTGTSHAGWLKEETTFNPIYFDTLQETIRAVAEGKADVFIGNMAASTYWIRKLNITNLRAAAPVSQERQLLHMAVRKDWPILVTILNKGLASISPEEAEEIKDRWTAAGYSIGIPAELVRKRILMIIGAALSLILIFWFWNRRLRREITLRTRAEEELHQSRERLADQVAEQTRELAEANAALKREMQAKEEILHKLHRSEKMEALGLMAGGVAHDLNNILAGVVSYPDLLLLELPEDSPLREPIRVIKDSGIRAAAVVADLLTIARGVALAKQSKDPNSLINECLASPEYKKVQERFPRVHCTTTLQQDLSKIFCSPVHIKKCVMNLLTNAFEAIEGEGSVSITTSDIVIEKTGKTCRPEPGQWVVIQVTDTGPGIPDEDIKHIFEPFYSKKVLGRSGTGLGLAIVWNTVHDHGGTVTVESSDKGTVFSLFFPVTDQPECVMPDSIPATELQGDNETVLIVDDEARQREIACRILTSLGYQVESAGSGEEALTYLSRHQVDLVVLDMIMEPGMNGLQTYREILQITPGQKAIIVSGFSENDAVTEAMNLGASCFIKKPYTCSQLGFAVRRELRKTG